MEKQVSCEHLKPGMYVSQLDRPWVETPFLFQGFFIQGSEDMDALRKHCHYVYIDAERGADVEQEIASPASGQKIAAKPALCPNQAVTYEDTVSFEDEFPTAKKNHQQVCTLMNSIMEEVQAGRKLNTAAAREIVNKTMPGILRNPNTFMWLSRLKKQDSYTYTHCVDACTLAIAFGRHLGLPREELETLAQGTLLADIGKMKIPPTILQKKTRLIPEEFALIKKHVHYTVEILKKTEGISEEIIEVAYHHHERYNGSGYPQGLGGDDIPLYARMAAIADCYDAMTSNRPYAKALSPHTAIQKLYEFRNVDFQDELVEQFVQCLGAYPVGTLVELSTGQVGVVLAQNRVRRLRPQVMILLDANKKTCSSYSVINLLHELDDEEGNPLMITNVLEAGAYGINPRDFYL
ncbi:Metal-dependent phosphohydrolase, HD subdomain [Nitrosococcus oceani ATCC 19707]|uniref:Metal-dependent phosphohydrolase, HD subdomain n=2 Tax=Nitrosococcus oceani TaxID=1229 RepID=Q3JE70_NITOC|nr:HD-GYP domain-containing protein [Nitrosococcus oceani]ABA56876.1 Metal-dependent phosphohydrolase, HD subdomain [Nitrosococcus oceani ATCC 19707]KFI20659.1 metal-dependent phosphohydrolase [Nitrosococcus oceani C-27]